MKDKLTADYFERLLHRWIATNFGDSEANDPSYNLELLADYLASEMQYVKPDLLDLSDEATNTLTILRNATWLEDDLDIENACREVADHLEADK